MKKAEQVVFVIDDDPSMKMTYCATTLNVESKAIFLAPTLVG